MEPTMTLVELAAEFRAHGISTSLVTLGDGIEQGVYPFAICIKGKQRTFQISRYRAAEWIRWFTGEGDNPSVSPTASQLPLHKGASDTLYNSRARARIFADLLKGYL